MWATLALAAMLQPIPAQTGKITLSNVRTTYGILGPERKSAQLLPGDLLVVMFDIEGLKAKESGEVPYSMAVKLTNKAGKLEYENAPADFVVFNALGGSKVAAAFAMTNIGLDTPPGEYTFTITVIDPATKASEKLERKFEVLPMKLGFVKMWFTDLQLSPVPPVGVVGQNLVINFGLVGFEVDAKKNPDVSFEVRILDADGKPTTKPITDSEKVPDSKTPKVMPRQYQIPLNRSGKFTIEIKATDNSTKKSVEEKMSITVLDMPK